MKIAILVNLFPPENIGGVAISTYNTADNLSKRGHEVHVLTIGNDPSKKNTDYEFYVHRVPRKKIKVLGSIIFLSNILAKLRSINPDIVHVEGLWMGIPGYLAKKIFRFPYVVTGHGSDIYLQPKSAIYFRSKPVLKYADAVIALTEHMKNRIENIYKREIFVVPNGIELKNYENIFKTSGEKNQKILFVGSLVYIKGVKYLIESMKIIKSKYPNTQNIQLIIIGDGGDKYELEKLVQEYCLCDSVYFAGKVQNHMIPQYMVDSDIFVLPSLSEGFGIVLLEAMASGLPIVASNVGGIPNLIKDGVNGFLVESENPEKIAERIVYLLNNEELMLKISENNKKVVKQFDWEKIVIQIENIYQKIVVNK